MIYLDNAATTPMDPLVLEAMLPYLKESYGNPSAIYKLGREARAAVEKARLQVATLIGAKPEQIIFTSGGTEANNLVFQGLKSYLQQTGKTHIITSATEHDSVLNTVKKMCIKDGFYATALGVKPDGTIDPLSIKELINEETGLVSAMYVNNEIGSVNPINEISELCKHGNVLFHTDCVQAVGYHPIDVKKIGCDFLSISSHKIHGPKGVGALYVKNPKLLDAVINGGEAQESGLRGGTENVAGIVGFGRACEITKDEIYENARYIKSLKKMFVDRIEYLLNEKGIHGLLEVNGAVDKKTPNESGILNLKFKNIDSETLLLMLDGSDVYASSGSACREHESKPSRILLEIGLTPDEARSSIRISLSRMNTCAQILSATQIITHCVEVLLNEISVG